MILITPEDQKTLLDNWRAGAADDSGAHDPKPVVKLFTPDGSSTWLITEMDTSDEDRLFGLCDLGHGYPELGYVLLSEIESVRGPLGLPVERDLHFRAKHPISLYADMSQAKGRITTDF